MKKSKGKLKHHMRSPIGAPEAVSFHDGIFGSKEEAVKAIASVVSFLEKFSKKSTDNNKSEGKANQIGFVIENLVVSFRINIQRIKLHTHFASDTTTILYPVVGSESEEELRDLELKILNHFHSSVPEAQMRAALQFFRTLNLKARQDLQEHFGGEIETIINQIKDTENK